MNSPIKLPSIPYELLESLSDGEVPLVRAYAEQAVRDALAAQQVKAWLIRERKNGTDPMFTIATTTEPFASTYWPLAIIPENNHE